ncbi:MAG: hypothetical protein ACI89E_001090, partial [Planctomycetota bacterium]
LHSGTALDLPPIAFNYRGCNPPCSEMDGRFLAQSSMPDTLLAVPVPFEAAKGPGTKRSNKEIKREARCDH